MQGVSDSSAEPAAVGVDDGGVGIDLLEFEAGQSVEAEMEDIDSAGRTRPAVKEPLGDCRRRHLRSVLPGFGEDGIDHRLRRLRAVRSVGHGLPVNVLLPVRAVAFCNDTRGARQGLLAAESARIVAERRDEFFRQVRDIEPPARIGQERGSAVALRQPASLVDGFGRCFLKAISGAEPRVEVPDQACVESRDRRGILD